MQENVQSEFLGPYSQRRNSNPSKNENSDRLLTAQPNGANTTCQWQAVYIEGKFYLADQATLQKLKQIESEIEKQKQLITKLKQGDQLSQKEYSEMDKSYLSLQGFNVEMEKNQSGVSPADYQHQTKTELPNNSNVSFLEERRQKAIEELEKEENKYRENIRKMQLKRSQMKRQFQADKKDLEIGIKVMDLAKFDELKKQNSKQQQHKEEDLGQKGQKQQSLAQRDNKLSEKSQSNANSRLKQSTEKKYSVKKSSVVVPESNQSIREIEERRQRQSEANKSVSRVSRSKVSSKKGSIVDKGQKAAVANERDSQQQTELLIRKQHLENTNSEKNKSIKSLKNSQKGPIKQSQKQSCKDAAVIEQTKQGVQQSRGQKLDKTIQNDEVVSQRKSSRIQQSKNQQALCGEPEENNGSKVSRKNEEIENKSQSSGRKSARQSEKGSQRSSKSVKQPSQSSEKQEIPQSQKQSLSNIDQSRGVQVVNNAQQIIPETLKTSEPQKEVSEKSFKKKQVVDQSIQWSQVDPSMLNNTMTQNNRNEDSCQNLLQAVEDKVENSNPMIKRDHKVAEQIVLAELQESAVNGNHHSNIQSQNNKVEYQGVKDSVQKQTYSKIEESNSHKVKNIEERSKASSQVKEDKPAAKTTFIMRSREGSVKEKRQGHQQYKRDHSLKQRKRQLSSEGGGDTNSKKPKPASVINKDLLLTPLDLSNAKGNIINPHKLIKGGESPVPKAVSYRSRKSSKVKDSTHMKAQNGKIAAPKSTVNFKEGNIEIQNQDLLRQNNFLQKKGEKSHYDNDAPSALDQSGLTHEKSRVLIPRKDIEMLHQQIKRLEQKLQAVQSKQDSLLKAKDQQIIQTEENVKKAKEELLELERKNDEELKNFQQELQAGEKQLSENKPLVEDQQIKQQGQSITDENGHQPEIDHRNDNAQQPQKQVNPQVEYQKEKQKLNEQISRLRRIIRDLQIEKIKSIDYGDGEGQTERNQQNKAGGVNETIEAPDGEKPSISAKSGTIKHQGGDNGSTIQNRSIVSSRVSRLGNGYGKIVKNSPQKSPQLRDNNKNSIVDKKTNSFRINLSKKPSNLSDNIFGKSAELMSPIHRKNNKGQESQTELPLNKKGESQYSNPLEGNLNLNRDISQIQPFNRNDSKVSNQVLKEDVMQKLQRTNRQFHKFVEQSRIVNETNSSMSMSQTQNTFLNGLGRSDSKRPSRVNNQQSEIANPEYNRHEDNRFLPKLQNSQGVEQQEVSSPQKEFSPQQFPSSHSLQHRSMIGQQSFTRIINEMKRESPTEEEEADTEIQIRDIEIPELPECPNVDMNQNQLVDLAQAAFGVFGIEVHISDNDFTMKKYKNCVILTKGSETILWHYNGKFYMGGWKNKDGGEGEKTGEGIEIIPQKHIYKGQFLNGKKHGNGVIKSSSGNIYDGQWVEGIKQGNGTYYDKTTKVVYKGQWKNGKKSGYGLLKFSQKEYYQGTFVKSVKEGYGTQIFVNGDKYQGEYKRGKFYGKGKYFWSNGSTYEGDFIDGMRHGSGCWKSSKENFDIYVGTYQNDKKSGYGRYVWANGCMYDGSFAEDVKHGKGKLVYTDGKEIKGVWNEGTLVEANSSETKGEKLHQDEKLKNPAMKFSFGGQQRMAV